MLLWRSVKPCALKSNHRRRHNQLKLKQILSRNRRVRAISSGDKNTVAELLKSKDLDLTVQNNDGKTALTIAQEMRQKATTADEQKKADQILLALGVKP